MLRRSARNSSGKTGRFYREFLHQNQVHPNFYPYDENPDGIDMFDALHPQTILAYGMNGRDLPVSHGAPLRVRVETQMGYKSVKFLSRIVVKNEFDDMGKLGLIQSGWSWYAGI